MLNDQHPKAPLRPALLTASTTRTQCFAPRCNHAPAGRLELAPERLGIGSGEYANSGQLWLLRARRERPPRRGAEQRMNSRRFN